MADDDVKKERAPRFACDLRVKVHCAQWQAVQRVAAANVSRGGLFISTSTPPAVGSRVQLDVELPDGTIVTLHGECVHTRTPGQALQQQRPPGFGVRIDPDHLADLMLLEELAKAASTAESQPAGKPPSPSVPSELEPAPVEEPSGTTYVAVRRKQHRPPPESTRSPEKPIPTASVAPSSSGTQTAPPRAPSVLRGLTLPVGIDFGTTYTRLAVHDKNGAYLTADEHGRTMFPSVVFYPEEGGAIVGWDARDHLALEPQRTIASPKRLLGRTLDHHEIQGYLASATFHSERGPNDQVVLRIGHQPLAIPQVCASIIRHACEVGERWLGSRIHQAVLSMPVTFGPEQEAALRRAAVLAGIEVIGTIEEPVAAAVAYGCGQGVNEVVAVYDFGGGTFDFSILDASGHTFRVLKNHGDSWLGGDDFDLVLAQWTADQFWRQTTIELRQRVVEWQRLLLAAEEAKRRLSNVTDTVVEVPKVVLAPQPTDLRVPVTRELLGQLCHDLVMRSLEVCQEGLQAVGLEARDIGQLVLTGGVTHMPLVREAVVLFFEREATPTVSPEAAVAQGAALHAMRLLENATS